MTQTLNMTQYSTAIVQSPTIGLIKDAGHFNDIEKVISSGGSGGINTKNPIIKLIVRHGAVIDGIDITYQKSDTSTSTMSHGTNSSCTDTSLHTDAVDIADGEQIIAVTGTHGLTTTWGTRVVNLQFAIFNTSTGVLRLSKQFGNAKGPNSFSITANGNFVSFGGYSIDTNLSIAQAIDKGAEGGVYGLFFHDVVYSTV